jgi:hypothetical protein
MIRFVLTTVTHEPRRRRNERLGKSLRQSHPESLEMAEAGLASWAERLPGDASDLFDHDAGEEMRWVADHGWVRNHPPL